MRTPRSLTERIAKFLISLGLRRFPPLSELLDIIASDNQIVREIAMTFFLDNVSLKYSDYDPNNYRDLAFVPAVRGSEKVLAKPFEVRGSHITISPHLS